MSYLSTTSYKIKGINFFIYDTEKEFKRIWWNVVGANFIPYAGVSKSLWEKERKQIIKEAIMLNTIRQREKLYS